MLVCVYVGGFDTAASVHNRTHKRWKNSYASHGKTNQKCGTKSDSPMVICLITTDLDRY